MKTSNNEEIKLPDLTQEPIKYVDATPDDEYPLRILRAYRKDCNCMWETNPPGYPIYDMMNEHQIQRAAILDKAIEALSAYDSILGKAEKLINRLHNESVFNPNITEVVELYNALYDLGRCRR